MALYFYNDTGEILCSLNARDGINDVDPAVSSLNLLEDNLPLQGNVKVENGILVQDNAMVLASQSLDARIERDTILGSVVDPLATNPLRWAELTADKQAEWAQYRTDLLDVPDQSGFPNDITWPTRPE